MQPSFPIPPAWRWRLAIGGVVALGFGLWLFTFAYHRVAKANFEAHIAELAAKGESLEVDDLRPPPIENLEDDVAAAPVFAEFFERCRKDPKANEEDDPVWGRLRLKKIPGFFGDVNREKTQVRFLTSYSLTQGFDSPDEEAIAKMILDYAEEHASTLGEIREALFRPKADFQVPYGEIGSMLSGGRVFSDTCELFHRHGQAAQFMRRHDIAKSNVVAMLRFSRHLGSQSTFIFSLDGFSSQELAISLIREGVAGGKWSEEDLIAFAYELESRWAEAAFLSLVRMNRALAVVHWRELTRDPESWGNVKDPWTPRLLLIPNLRNGWDYDNLEHFCCKTQETFLEDRQGNPLKTRIIQPMAKFQAISPARSDLSDQIRFRLESFRRCYAESGFPGVGGVRFRAVRTQVLQDHALIAISLALHQLKNGRLPATLDGLTLPSGAPLPLDPFTGVNYVYRPEGETDYLLYSPGPNGLDEGGLIRHRYEDGDWVWRLRLPEDFDYDAYRGQ